MLNFVGIVGNNYSGSVNRLLLQNIKQRYAERFDLALLETGALPLYSQDTEQAIIPVVDAFRDTVAAADGIIIATAEHNHSIPAALKNALDWSSRVVHPFDGKKVMIVGAALGPMGTVRAQMHLRQILDAPGIGAQVMPGNEFLLTNATAKFDATGVLVDQPTLTFLDTVIDRYVAFSQSA